MLKCTTLHLQWRQRICLPLFMSSGDLFSEEFQHLFTEVLW